MLALAPIDEPYRQRRAIEFATTARSNRNGCRIPRGAYRYRAPLRGGPRPSESKAKGELKCWIDKHWGAFLEDSGVASNPEDNSADASGAVYVFARSASVWSEQAYVKAANTGRGDRFGKSIASSADGNMLAVGAPVVEP